MFFSSATILSALPALPALHALPALAAIAVVSAATAAPAAAELTPEQYAKLPVCTLSADGKRLAVEPCRTAPATKQMPRRPVPQFSSPTSRMAAPRNTEVPQPSWGPVLTPATPPSGVSAPAAVAGAATVYTPGQAPVVPTLPPLTPLPGPGAPTPVQCGPGGCRDPASGTFIPGPAGTGISPAGRLCSNNGQWMTCQ